MQIVLLWFECLLVFYCLARIVATANAGGLGWTCPPHFCQRLFLGFMQIQ